MVMKLDMRGRIARAAGQRLYGKFRNVPPAERQRLLDWLTEVVHDALCEEAGQRAFYSLRYFCPSCRRTYALSVLLRGHTVTCVECGCSWRITGVQAEN